jgi:hypothetical protein
MDTVTTYRPLVVRNLLEVGVPKDHIVLAFRSPEMRQDTEFAVA